MSKTLAMLRDLGSSVSLLNATTNAMLRHDAMTVAAIDTAIGDLSPVSHPRNSVFPVVFCDVADELAYRHEREAFD